MKAFKPTIKITFLKVPQFKNFSFCKRLISNPSSKPKISFQTFINTKQKIENRFFSTSTSNEEDLNQLFEEANTQLRTVRDFIRFAASRFSSANLVFGQGTENALEEANYLIFHTLHLFYSNWVFPSEETIAKVLDARITQSEKTKLLQIIKRRIVERIPASYLTNQVIFGDYIFYVDQRSIIPRSLIAEVLVNDKLSPWLLKPAEETNQCLDLCTGNGSLAIITADVFPSSIVDAVDISPQALEVAKINLNNLVDETRDRINLIESDLFLKLDKKKKYDLIISNPPYVTTEAMNDLPTEYKHEPSLALWAGDDGLKFVREILNNAPQYLAKDGVIVVEAGQKRQVIEKEFPNIAFSWISTSVGDDDVFILSHDSWKGKGLLRKDSN